MTATQTIRWILKPLVFVAALGPFAWLIWAAATGNFSADPLKDITNETGSWTLNFLCLTLAVTPFRRLSGWSDAIRFRRMLGLFAFFYATCHLAAYYAFDLNFSLKGLVADTAKRPFIFMGMAAFLAMLPLALTSTKGWIRRLGKKWALLHRLVYVSAICAAIHFAWKVKVFVGDPVLYAAAVAVLLLFRVVWAARRAAVWPVRPPKLPVP